MTTAREILRSEPDVSRSPDAFLRRLAQAAAWCDARADVADPRWSLRSEPLQPRLLDHDAFATVWHVSTAREHQVRRAGLSPALPAAGRLLVYFPDAELSDGAAEAETGGWFDVFNTPPWDSWVAFAADDSPDPSTARYLIAYVPPAFVALCSEGIAVNPEACILWLDDAEVAFRDFAAKHAPHMLR